MNNFANLSLNLRKSARNDFQIWRQKLVRASRLKCQQGSRRRNKIRVNREKMAHKSKYYKELDDGVLDLSMQNLKVVRNGIFLFKKNIKSTPRFKGEILKMVQKGKKVQKVKRYKRKKVPKTAFFHQKFSKINTAERMHIP